jgi:hypothetical protein
VATIWEGDGGRGDNSVSRDTPVDAKGPVRSILSPSSLVLFYLDDLPLRQEPLRLPVIRFSNPAGRSRIPARRSPSLASPRSMRAALCTSLVYYSGIVLLFSAVVSRQEELLSCSILQPLAPMFDVTFNIVLESEINRLLLFPRHSWKRIPFTCCCISLGISIPYPQMISQIRNVERDPRLLRHIFYSVQLSSLLELQRASTAATGARTAASSSSEARLIQGAFREGAVTKTRDRATIGVGGSSWQRRGNRVN